MNDRPQALLLDTCALIYLANDEPIADGAKGPIQAAATAGLLLVSPVTGWEIGLLCRPERRSPLRLRPDPRTWLAEAISGPGIRLAPFTAEIGLDSAFLPPPIHADPADRLLIATARTLAVPIVTRDRAIIAYGAAGFVRVVPC